MPENYSPNNIYFYIYTDLYSSDFQSTALYYKSNPSGGGYQYTYDLYGIEYTFTPPGGETFPSIFFYPNYGFYNSTVNLDQYFNYTYGPIIQINANYGYYIPVYQDTGKAPYWGLFTNCNNTYSSVLNMVQASWNGACFQYVDTYLYYTKSTQSIEVQIPSTIQYYEIIKTIQPPLNYIYYEVVAYNATNNGYSTKPLIAKGSTSLTPITNNYSAVYINASVPTSGGQANIYAFYDKQTN
jgi:hypothetical protein